MNEVDLIPADYRQNLNLKRHGKRFLLLFGCMALVIVGGKGWLSQSIEGEREAIQRLKTGEIELLQQKNRFEELRLERSDLTNRLQVLSALRGGPPAERIFVQIDRAINRSVWFTELKFIREGQVQKAASQSGSPGYFVMVSNDASRNLNEPLSESTRIEIRGQALTHSALAEFVSRLLAQSGIANVYLLHTGSRSYSTSQVIDYQLAVVVNLDEEGD